MARIIRILFLLFVVTGGVVGGYFWLQAREPDNGGLELIPVTKGSITEKAVAVGQIEPRLKFHVKSKISGIVRRCLIEVGDRVEPGDPLFEIVPDPTPIELVEAERRVDVAHSAFKRARADWGRTSELARQGILSNNELDAAKESFELTRIELASAGDNLKLVREGRISERGREMESFIRAPAGGIVLQRNVDPGDPVVPLTSFQEGTELATIADMGDLIFKGTVDEIDVGKLFPPELPARLKIGALPAAEVTGMLSRIAPQAREEDGARLFDVEIELDPVTRGRAAGRLLRQRRPGDPRKERHPARYPSGWCCSRMTERARSSRFRRRCRATNRSRWRSETGLSDGLNIEVVSGLAGARRGGPATATRNSRLASRLDGRFQRAAASSCGMSGPRNCAPSSPPWASSGAPRRSACCSPSATPSITRSERPTPASEKGIVITWPSQTSIPYEGLGKGRSILLTEDDLESCSRSDPCWSIQISSEYQDNLQLQLGPKRLAVDVSGVHPAFERIRNLIPVEGGRFVNPIDMKLQAAGCLPGRRGGGDAVRIRGPRGPGRSACTARRSP